MNQENVELRALEPEDLQLIYEAENDSELWHVGDLKQPISKYTVQAYLAEAHQTIEDAHQVRFAIENIDQNVVGLLDLFDYDARNMRAAIGIVILKQHRKKGYAAAAIAQVKYYAKKHLLLNQLHCQVQECNVESINLFMRCGFKKSGKLEQWQRTLSGFENVLVMQCLL